MGKNKDTDKVHKRIVGKNGDAKQFVCEHYPEELSAIQNSKKNAALVVMIDGDNSGPAKRIQELRT